MTEEQQKSPNAYYLSIVDEEMLVIEPRELFDKAIVGFVERCGQEQIACYSYDKIIDLLIEDGCTELEALDHFHYNIGGAWHGDRTPCFLHGVEDV